MSTPELSVSGAVATITLRRPEQANRLSPEDLATLAAHIATLNATPEVLVLQLRGEGKYFCSGYDISRIGAARSVNFEEVVDALEDARPVTIALVHGGVYGGATDFALACDFRLGVPGADMFMPAARLGLHFYQRGLERYVSRLGLDNAKRLFLTAEKIGAEEMKAIGFLTQLVQAGELEAAAARLAATCAGMAPIALLGMKRHLNRIGRGVLNVAELQDDMRRAIDSDDLREGQAAWSEKRAPRFTGR
ncbi:enoyl-CoA hydratase/isomerase family protein [Variovorax sp. J22P271]|uniref:enoyl-CoA hydratase/isomerase family protein n=1 Tax=Variovorax davisae TaxID=3053515 RepID=UPI002575F270|nr:enoyl-CoA hydratase/isomerase family protein [Variovorax sp. J22P271]MDM0034477.1 enoyl-CoA hydratase/isomerase family protein [Variovorax sp. J22P271]